MPIFSTIIATGALGLLALVLLILGRASVAAALGIGGRLPPFGEPLLSSLGRAGLLGRVVVALAGLVAIHTFITAIFVLAMFLGGEVPASGPPVVNVIRGMPAEAAGVRDGDRLVGLNGTRLGSFTQLREHLDAHPLAPVAVEVERGGQVRRFIVEPEKGRIGVSARFQPISAGEAVRQGVWLPLQVWATFASSALEPTGPITLTGPVGIIRSSALTDSKVGPALMAIALHLSWALPRVVMASLALLLAVPWRRQAPAPAQVTLQPGRPWIRWLARLLDGGFFLLAIEVIEGLTGRSAALVVAVLSIPFEAFLLATWGYTPGKWLLGVAVRSARGGKLALGEALHRAGAAMIFGMGAGLDFNVVTGLVAKRRLERTGSTYWDDLGGFRVTHEPIGGLRVLLFIFLLMVGLTMVFRSYFRHPWG